MDLSPTTIYTPPSTIRPGVSCLMITRDRLEYAKRSIKCFQDQTYPNCELVVVDQGSDDTRAYVESLNDPRIIYHHTNDPKLTIGEMRNISIDIAMNDLVATWDDDDWHHPSRISFQLQQLELDKADICMLGSITLAWIPRQKYAYSSIRYWENTLLGNRTKMARYPAWPRGSDTALVQQSIEKQAKLTWLNAPDLYIYVLHGSNTWNDQHFTWQFQQATAHLTGGAVTKILDNLGIDPKDIPEFRPTFTLSQATRTSLQLRKT